LSLPASKTADPGYLSTLGLQRAPFLDQIDDRFFYADPVLVQRLDLLQHLTQFGDMLLGVLGPNGSGKSTLLQQFISRGGTAWRCCRIHGAQIGAAEELFAKLALCFALDTGADPERTKAALLRHFQSLKLTSQLPVILIDDAHLLPDVILKALLDLGGSAKETLKLARIVLFAEPGLEQKLTQAGLHSPQQPLLHSLEVPSFDIQQSAAYLMYRLAVAGYSGDSPFSLTEIRALHKAAEGLPGRLNVLAHETLMERAGRIAARNKTGAAKTSGGPAMPGATRKLKRLGILGGTLGLAALAWLALQSGLLELPMPAPSLEEPHLTQTPIDLPIPESTESASDEAAPEEIAEPEATEHALTEEAAHPIDMPAEKPASTLESTPAEAAAEPGIATFDTSPPAATPVPATTTGPTATPVPATSAESEPATLAAIDTPAAEPPQVPTEPPAATASGETSAQPPEAAGTAGSAGAPEPQRDAPPAAITPSSPGIAAATPVASVAAPNAIHREDWLQERPATHYTLQLLGVRSETALRDYLAKHKPPGPVAYFRTDYKGGEWYVLVQGDYPSMAAARAAIAALPAAVRKAQPWPRSFATVHADIEKAGAGEQPRP
jgi:DamX protein